MPGISDTIATIRSCLGSTNMTLSEQLRKAAEVYAEECAKVNERLARCEQLLRQGMRAEAIRQAEIDPDLLEAVTELDFEGRDEWEERLMLNDLPSPPAINRKAIELLNRAYADEAPLSELLKHQRLLALARAPLRERVETVRQLAKAEPTNAGWSEDVATFEAARIDEMRAELRQIRQTNNWQGIQMLSAELAVGKWHAFLPLDLIAEIESEFKRVARLDAELKFKTHRELLQQAKAEFNLERCHQIRALIERISRERQIQEGDVLLEPLRPLLSWLAEQDRQIKETRRFETACRNLSEAISQKADPTMVEGLYKGLVDFDRPIPKELKHAYQVFMGQADDSRVRAVRLFAVALVLMAGVFVGLIVLFMRKGGR